MTNNHALVKDRALLMLNFITIFSFIFYAIGIYLHVGLLGEEWGNIAVDLAIQIIGPIIGVIMVVVIGTIILLLTYRIQKFKLTNIFLCWFWIFSLYQCAINAILQFYGLPDEPINQFFKLTFSSFWYPIKEICFAIVALLLTYIWINKISKMKISKLDLVFLSLVILILIGGTVLSQIFLIN